MSKRKNGKVWWASIFHEIFNDGTNNIYLKKVASSVQLCVLPLLSNLLFKFFIYSEKDSKQIWNKFHFKWSLCASPRLSFLIQKFADKWLFSRFIPSRYVPTNNIIIIPPLIFNFIINFIWKVLNPQRFRRPARTRATRMFPITLPNAAGIIFRDKSVSHWMVGFWKSACLLPNRCDIDCGIFYRLHIAPRRRISIQGNLSN